MRRLIVNGDDFGLSQGVNRGIVEAYARGVLTSTSMMVDMPASADAGRLAGEHPELGVGLHVVLAQGADPDSAAAEIERQLARFADLTGRPPTHLDSHHHVHRDPDLLPAFLAATRRHGLPLRDHCGVRHIGGFYGRWDGETHLEQVGPSALERLVATEVADGVSELCCHPGYVGDDLRSSYTVEREAELATLCDPRVGAMLREHGIRLVSFREVPGP